MKTLKLIFGTVLLSLVLACALPSVTDLPGVAKAAGKISKKKATLTRGETLKLKIAGKKGTVRWSSSRKSVASVSKNGKVTAKKKGSATITAEIGKKKYTCRIKVKNPAKGTRENPRSAYTAFTSDIYYFGRYLGKYKIQLIDYRDGTKANDYVMRWSYNAIPGNDEEYLYLRFKVRCISSGQFGKKEYASDLINLHVNLFDRTGIKQIRRGLVGTCIGEQTLSSVTLKPGASITCYEAVLIPSGNTPVTYRLETGYDSAKHESRYTWFTTKR